MDDDGCRAVGARGIDDLPQQAGAMSVPMMAPVTPTGTKAPLPVAFSSTGSVDNDGTIVSYAWDFENDGVVDSTDQDTATSAAPAMAMSVM